MKKIRLLLVAALLSFAFLMTGCSDGSTLETTMNLDKSCAGNRTMDLVVNDSVFQENFTGSYEDLDALIDATCPDSLTWGKTESEDGVKKYTFVLNFSSPEDYKAKVEALIGEERELTMEVAESIWSNGFILNERFGSGDIMQWLKDAIVAAGYVTEDHASRIFGVGNSTVNFGGETYSAYNNISVNTVEYLSINSIIVQTEILDVENYKETVVIEVPKVSMDKKGDEIGEFMKNATPEGATMVADDSSGTGTVYTITCNMTNMQGLQNQLQTILGEGKATLTADEQAADNKSPFRYALGMQQTMNFGSFVAGDYQSLRFEYLIKLPEGFSMDQNKYRYRSDENPSYPGFIRIFNTSVNGTDSEFPIYLTKTFTVASMNVETVNKGLDSWTRTTEFNLKETPSEAELNAIADQFTKKAQSVPKKGEVEYAEVTKEDGSVVKEQVPVAEDNMLDIKVSSKTKDGVAAISIEQKGTGDEMEKGSRALFGEASTLTFGKKTGSFKVKKNQAVIDNFRYASIVGETGEDFILYYTLKVGGSCIDTNLDVNQLKSDKGGKLVAEFTYPNQKVEWYGTYTDVLALITIVLIAAGIALVAVAVVLAVLKMGKAKAAAPMAAPSAAAAAEAPAAFCANCGTKLEAGTAFCSNCGTKVQ